MKKYLSFLLVSILLFGGCANPHIIGARTPDQKIVARTLNVEVEFDGVGYSDEIINMIHDELEKFPKAQPYISDIIIKEDIEGTITGRFNQGEDKHGIITLKLQSISSLREVFWHEMCHAMQRTLTDDQLLKWCEIAAQRMEEAKIDNFAGEKWCEMKESRAFPSLYSHKNIYEFMSEHLEELCADPEHYKTRFPEEYKLLGDCGWLPIK